MDTVDLLGLARAECFLWRETPDAFEQALATEHLVNAGDAPGEAIGGIENSGVGVSRGDGQAKRMCGDAVSEANRIVASVEKLDRAGESRSPSGRAVPRRSGVRLAGQRR